MFGGLARTASAQLRDVLLSQECEHPLNVRGVVGHQERLPGRRRAASADDAPGSDADAATAGLHDVRIDYGRARADRAARVFRRERAFRGRAVHDGPGRTVLTCWTRRRSLGGTCSNPPLRTQSFSCRVPTTTRRASLTTSVGFQRSCSSFCWARFRPMFALCAPPPRAAPYICCGDVLHDLRTSREIQQTTRGVPGNLESSVRGSLDDRRAGIGRETREVQGWKPTPILQFIPRGIGTARGS